MSAICTDPKMTIGMAAYDDFDGVYFTIQALRIYHPDVRNKIEIVLVDNNPDGPAHQALKDFIKSVPNARYIPKTDKSGTAIRNCVFDEARAPFVLCLDCHVLVIRRAIRRLLEYFEAHPDTRDLLQGPLLYDDLGNIATHMDPTWRKGMYGCWATDPAGQDLHNEPFEIGMQGLGLFACRRAAWPGFNSGFSGFGGEEGYIHEKFRRAGGRTLCLPFLRWTHRFARPQGVPYRITWEDRLRNYLIGFKELGLDTADMESHFRSLLGDSTAVALFQKIRHELDSRDMEAQRLVEPLPGLAEVPGS